MFPCAYRRLKLNPSLLTKKITFPEGANQKGRQIGLLAGGKLRLLAIWEQRAACLPPSRVACLLGHPQHLPPSHLRNFKYLCLYSCIKFCVEYSVVTDKVCFFPCSLSNMSLLLNIWNILVTEIENLISDEIVPSEITSRHNYDNTITQ
jgi:hypothetical protein